MNDIRSCCLTIAGSDSGGNAGVQADLRAFHAYKLHGCTVFTALTAQNPNGVYGINEIPSDFVAAQLDAVLGTYSIGALKTGMLGTKKVVETVAEKLSGHKSILKVIDPVMVATSGAKLAKSSTLAAMKKHLLPIATLITPNIPEAEILSRKSIRTKDAMRDAAKNIYDKFGAAVLIKGGHSLNKSAAADVFFDGKDFFEFVLPWIKSPVSTHGTGCSLSAAIVSELVMGNNLKEAIKGAKKYVHKAISNSYFVGAKCGVLK